MTELTKEENSDDVQSVNFMELYQLIFSYKISSDTSKKSCILMEIMASIEKFEMAPFYNNIADELQLTVDHAFLTKLKKLNQSQLESLSKSIDDAKENHGDVEVAAAIAKKANYLLAIGDKDAAIKEFDNIPSKALSTGQKIDIAMTIARVSIAEGDWKLAKKSINDAKELNEKGGDWDRRNRLKVYEGVLLVALRDFKGASPLLLDSIATFTASEFISYKRFMFVTVLATLYALDRPTLKKKVINSPDVISVLVEDTHLNSLLSCFYDTKYKEFLVALLHVEDYMNADSVTASHSKWYVRELRLASYVQFLDSYRSVTLQGMSTTFGISVELLEKDMVRFISAGRLNARIDSISGIVETTRPDTKNGQYHSLIKHGDALLVKVQKLSRVVTL